MTVRFFDSSHYSYYITCVCASASASASASVSVRTVRAGFLHLAEVLAYRRDSEVAVRAVIDMLKAGERCNPEAELIGKGRRQPAGLEQSG